ncbi:uncharacterized protein LOC124154172 [Ischnura elegans]|uniref:uncharacterized protein LOC124154172 n=1 Tax=Ischnura elegans TaxID=197161 RepID=UPI001ED8A8F1|nr:uncharacterized protein LOC124154172 [Ischnura elegans]XP_046383691.1 uncharacterized protein LOC124154172 [Ischnura elegans]XP_046383692.1 uncharacterized protein LOC124154172 [Ischnura elegans]
MATGSSSASASGQSVEDKLFTGVVESPFDQFEEMLAALNDVDIKRGDQKTTLLLIAVKLGKVDWVEGLLAMGADPHTKSEDGLYPLKRAEEMAQDEPGNADRQLIWRFIRMVERRDRVKRGQPSRSNAAADSGDLQDVITAVKESVTALKAEMPTFVSQMTGMTATVGEMKETVTSRDGKLEGLQDIIMSSAQEIKALKEKLLQSKVIST